LEELDEIRADLVQKLRARSGEIEDALVERVQALSQAAEGDDPDYRAGLRATVAESLDYTLLGIERGDEWEGPMPAAAAAQARLAARSSVPLETVLRRYAAGDRLVGEFILDEAADVSHEQTRQILGSKGPHVDRLMAAVAAEYVEELELLRRSPSQRRAERVQSLLAGGGAPEIGWLDYELDAWHLGLIITGPRPDVAARTLAAGLGHRSLVVVRGDETAWAWLGGVKPVVAEVERYMAADVLGPQISLAIGEPRHGLDGWRLTHHEAKAAQQVMLRRPRPLIQASDVLLLAAVLRDELLARSLCETYLAPLDEIGDSSGILRETLRAYFEAGFNAATAAAALQVDRHTVQRRLRKVEEALGRRLHTNHAEIEVALLIEELDEEPVLQAEGQFGQMRP
jgi:PucR-like helix-turn-helix protein/diguanylate cyclase with GGDEF domain